MVKQKTNVPECACPAECKVVVPVLMIVFGVIALVRELTGKTLKEQEA